MRSLNQLLQNPEGRDFLYSNGVYTSLAEFAQQVAPPLDSRLLAQLQLEPPARLVFASQQLYADYRQSVVSKFQALQGLEHSYATHSFFEWVDTDEAFSDDLISRFAWPASATNPVRLASREQVKHVETRYVTLDKLYLHKAIESLKNHYRQIKRWLPAGEERFAQLSTLFLSTEAHSLAEFNLSLATFLFKQTLDYVPRGQLSSHLLASGLLTAPLDNFINHLPGVIEIFNQTVHSLQALDIDPQVKPVEADFLPLYYSCERDNRRLKLRHQVERDNHFAWAACPGCDTLYKFYLGRHTLSVAEIIESQRWSPNICLPIFINDLVSGMVVGKSSALYGLVFNAVLGQVLGKQPIPLYVPNNLTLPANQPDSLLYRYFQR